MSCHKAVGIRLLQLPAITAGVRGALNGTGRSAATVSSGTGEVASHVKPGELEVDLVQYLVVHAFIERRSDRRRNHILNANWNRGVNEHIRGSRCLREYTPFGSRTDEEGNESNIWSAAEFALGVNADAADTRCNLMQSAAKTRDDLDCALLPAAWTRSLTCAWVMLPDSLLAVRKNTHAWSCVSRLERTPWLRRPLLSPSKQFVFPLSLRHM